MLGDSTTSVVEIPTKDIVSVREIAYGERLECSVRRVTVIDAQAAQDIIDAYAAQYTQPDYTAFAAYK